MGFVFTTDGSGKGILQRMKFTSCLRPYLFVLLREQLVPPPDLPFPRLDHRGFGGGELRPSSSFIPSIVLRFTIARTAKLRPYLILVERTDRNYKEWIVTIINRYYNGWIDITADRSVLQRMDWDKIHVYYNGRIKITTDGSILQRTDGNYNG